MSRTRKPSLSLETLEDNFMSSNSTGSTQPFHFPQGPSALLSNHSTSHTNTSTSHTNSSTSNDLEESYIANSEIFIKGKIAVHKNGVARWNDPKQFFLKYEDLDIGEIIGRGSSSVVLKTKHIPTNIPIALKVINLFDHSKRKQLVTEIATLYNAKCDTLITFYGAFYREGSISIALEYMDGGSISNLLAQVHSIPEHILLYITYQILWGLAYLQHEKRVHRDIKPSNLLINSKGQIKLSDFGVSAELNHTISMCNTFVGTFKYMSPERIKNFPYSYSSDTWSLGMTLIECVTGIYPLKHMASNCIELVQTIIDG